MRVILVDTETTGVKETDRVCEIAWIEITADFEIVDRDSSLINPGIPINPAASAVNGIVDSMVADAPTLAEYMSGRGCTMRSADVLLVGHNIAFDHRFLSQYVEQPANLLCTLKCARVIYPYAENHKQATLAYMLGLNIDRSRAHSADGDLEVLLQLAKRMCEDVGCTLSNLMEIQNIRREIKTMPFGKHKGLPLKDLPKDYVIWLLTKADNLNDDLRASLNNL